ncbi:MAG TPA: 2OG-Fe(II) oxygenase [Longimicrobiaceae bacterium]|nr:2OG-Fe(II) oxygenase [Longimicrobiaceae bacterium]
MHLHLPTRACTTMIDLLQIGGFLDPATLREVTEELRLAGGAPATVLSEKPEGAVQARVRKTTRVAVPPRTRERVSERLMERRAQIEAHFGVELGGCEEPQFLRYEEGDFFVPHQDGNTPLIHDQSRFRRISVVVFLSTPSDAPAPGTYGGGALVFHGSRAEPDLRVPVAPAPGTLVAFRAETTHEVTPVTHGERYTVVSWFREPGAPPA